MPPGRALLAAALSRALLPARSLSSAAGGASVLPQGLYFRQLQAGKDFALPATSGDDPVKAMARQMSNYIYAVGDLSTREAFVVDGAWDVPGIAAVIEGEDNMTLSGYVATHFHFDHIGGRVDLKHFGGTGHMDIPGIKEFAAWGGGMPAHLPTWEVELAASQTGMSPEAFSPLHDNHELQLGERVSLEFLHTPGHSPGSMCIRVRYDGKDALLITGDTVFPGSCGRLDLPGSDPRIMYDSLRRLAGLPDELLVFPGHSYNGASSTIGKEKQYGLLHPMTRDDWERQMVRR